MEKNIMQDESDFLKRLHEYGAWGYLWIFIVSMWAGTVRYLNKLNGKPFQFLGWVTDVITSGFVGIVTAMVCQYYSVDYLLTAAIVGITAHQGTRAIHIVYEILKKKWTIQVNIKR